MILKYKTFEGIRSHLKSRDVDYHKTQVLVDKKLDKAYFFLYNLSGQLVGYQQYNPDKPKDSLGRDESKYFTHVTKDQSRAIACYGLETYDMDSEYLFVTEGIFDIIKVHNAGYPGIAVLCNNPSNQLRSWLKTLPQKIVVINDNDDAGSSLSKSGDYSFTVPSPHKDLGDMTQEEANEFLSRIQENL